VHLHRPSSAVCHACFATAREAGRSTACGWHGRGIEIKEDGLSHVCRLEEELVAVDLLSWLLIGALQLMEYAVLQKLTERQHAATGDVQLGSWRIRKGDELHLFLLVEQGGNVTCYL